MTRNEPGREYQLVIAGVGGQGVVFLSRLLAAAATAAGRQVISYESHGMAMRGGSVRSQIKIGAFHSPLIASGAADFILLLAAAEFPQVAPLLSPRKGVLFCNHPAPLPLEAGGHCRPLDATLLALDHNLPRAVNLIMAGFAAAGDANFPFTPAELRQGLELLSLPAKKKAANLAALEIGGRAAG